MSAALRPVQAAESIWQRLRAEAAQAAEAEPALGSLLHAVILSHDDLAGALSFQLARKLGDNEVGPMAWREVCERAYAADPSIVAAAEADLVAVLERDPAAKQALQPFLFFKGFQSLQAHRVGHFLWKGGRDTLAFHLQSRVSELFQVDVHPAARIGKGVFFDHGTGIVVGETATIGDDVSMLHAVTLGGTGADRGDRHPKIGKGVLLGAGAKVLGNVEIGCGAKIGAGSVVLDPVPAHCTAAGVPARVVGKTRVPSPALEMDQQFPHIQAEGSGI